MKARLNFIVAVGCGLSVLAAPGSPPLFYFATTFYLANLAFWYWLNRRVVQDWEL